MMIRIFLKSKRGVYDAVALFDTVLKTVTVLKGSRISSTVAGGRFRSSKSIEKRREKIRKRRLLQLMKTGKGGAKHD